MNEELWNRVNEMWDRQFNAILKQAKLNKELKNMTEKEKHYCVNCKDLDNRTVNGVIKCYWTCPYREKGLLKKGLERWL